MSDFLNVKEEMRMSETTESGEPTPLGHEVLQFPGSHDGMEPSEETAKAEPGLDAKELTREKQVDWLLSELAHPSRRNHDPVTIAEHALKYLKPFLTSADQDALTPQDIDRRRALLMRSVETILLSDEQVREFAAQDSIYAAMDNARTSLGKDTVGLRERRKALHALQELRMGIVLADVPTDNIHWEEITRRLS